MIDELRKHSVERSFSSLGTIYLASYLRSYGDFNDIKILNVGQNLKPNFLKDFDIVGISSVTQNFNIAKEIADKVKKHSNALVLIGGHHITGLPNNLTENMDIAILGEGEQTTLEIVQAYKKNSLDLSKINGIAYKSNGNLKATPKRELIKPLDKIPFPARDLLPLNRETINMFTSRGCPYKCVFCSSSFFWKSVRFFSASYVVNEVLDVIAKYKPRHINFSDDLFISNKPRLRKISSLIREKKIHKETEFHCTARANLVDDETASLLKAMNMRSVSMGLESGSDRILQFLKGKSVTVEQNMRAIRILKKHGLNVSSTFIIGSPSETIQDIEKTLKFIKDSKLDGGDTYVLVPYPSTKIWDYAKEIGKVRDRMDWSRFEIYFEDHSNRIFLSETLTREELLKELWKFKELWRKRKRSVLFEQCFKHPSRILPFVYRYLKRSLGGSK